jgi:thiol-disulfide isomerase/thioredoxin
MKVLRILTLATIMIVATSLMIACSENKNEDVKSSTDLALSNTSASVSEQVTTETSKEETAQTRVYAITSVAAAVQGKAVDFTWKEDGNDLSFAELTKGKVVLLNFWGTWCPPCRMEIPDLVKLHNDLADKDFVMIGVALERNPTSALQKVANFAKAQNMSYYLFVDTSNDIVRRYGGINAVPTTFIIDKDGKIAETIVGMRDYNTFLAAINRVLK